jgi:hypothetical protein
MIGTHAGLLHLFAVIKNSFFCSFHLPFHAICVLIWKAIRIDPTDPFGSEYVFFLAI